MPTNQNTLKLLQKARALCTPPTWYRLSKATGIAETTISRCRKRGGTLGEGSARRTAALLQVPFAEVLAMVADDRARALQRQHPLPLSPADSPEDPDASDPPGSEGPEFRDAPATAH